jgi:hypothetical protein
MGTIERVAKALGDARVFEVALGGGETTAHPQFEEILTIFRSYGIVPNFTTKTLDWITDKARFERIMKHTGAFAYSVENADDVVDLVEVLPAAYTQDGKWITGGMNHRVTVQHVMGTLEKSEFERLLLTAAASNVRITLLGFKRVGRGATFTPSDYSFWLKSVLSVLAQHAILEKSGVEGRLSVSVDTALAAQYESEMKTSGIPAWCFHTTEGGFSCYLDAVNLRMAPSSYCAESEYRTFEQKGFSAERLASIFAEF